MADAAQQSFGPVATFVRDTLFAIVLHPEAIRIWETVGDTLVRVEFFVHAEDAAVVTGQAGEAIKALRALTTVVARRHNKRLALERRV